MNTEATQVQRIYYAVRQFGNALNRENITAFGDIGCVDGSLEHSGVIVHTDIMYLQTPLLDIMAVGATGVIPAEIQPLITRLNLFRGDWRQLTANEATIIGMQGYFLTMALEPNVNRLHYNGYRDVTGRGYFFGGNQIGYYCGNLGTIGDGIYGGLQGNFTRVIIYSISANQRLVR